MSTVARITESIDRPVILCPDRFVRERLYFLRAVEGWRRNREGLMCLFCLLGKHNNCRTTDCPCIHREPVRPL